MGSEGVGSYWPFATGRRVDQANLLLRQIEGKRKMRYILCPNQHVGAWRTGFMPQWIAREYLARRGHAKYRGDQITGARCTLLGYALNQLQVEGRMVGRDFLQVEYQAEVGEEAYDAGSRILYGFFERELKRFLHRDLDVLGRRIVECCLDWGGLEDFEKLLPTE